MIYSTDQIKGLHFNPHGHISISTSRDGMVKYYATGPFNKELVLALEQIENKALNDFKKIHPYWAEVVVFSQSCIILDDALEMLEQYIKTMADQNLNAVASAFVYPEGIIGAQLMKDKYKSCYDRAGLLFKGFTKEYEAVTWAREILKRAYI